MKRKTLTILGLGAACMACCAPLILTVLVWAGLAVAGAAGGGLIAGLSWDVILCGAVAVGVLAAAVIWFRRRWIKAGSTCDIETCGPNARKTLKGLGNV
ncbi:MAG: hypothetical protein ABI459_10445 [Deltaproteobacteria bacterium]